MSAPTPDGSGRVVLSSVHPEWGAGPGDAPGPAQDAFLKQLVDHAAGRGDHAAGKTDKRVLVFVGQNSSAYQKELRAALSRAVAKPSQIEMLESPASLVALDVGRRPERVILVIPGGYAVGKWEDGYMKEAAPKLRAAIAAGAGFLGICAGAYIGCTWWSDREELEVAPPERFRARYLAAAEDVFALGWAHGGGRMAAAAQVAVATGLGRLPVALFNGPLLAAGAHSRVLARFDDPAIAAVATAGSGLSLAAATVSERPR